MDLDPRWEEVQAVYRAASGASHELIPALAKIVETENWREFVRPNRGLQTYATFAHFCDGVLGLSAEAIEALLNRSTAKHAARLVTKAIREGVEPSGANGGDRKSQQYQSSNTTLISNVDSDTRDVISLLARLKRDWPDLAAEVIEGTLSTNAAAIRAGIKHQFISVRADDPGSAINSLLKHYTRTQLLETLNQLPAEETSND